MQLHIMLDEHLLKDAQQACGLPSAQATIEAALRALISQRRLRANDLLEKLNRAYAEDDTDESVYLHKMRRLYAASLKEKW